MEPDLLFSKDILIVSMYAMFGHGLKHLLGPEARLITVEQTNGIQPIIDLIKEVQPTVVIVDSEEPPFDRLISFINNLPEKNDPKLIRLSLENNFLVNDEKIRVLVSGVTDLLAAVR